VPKKIANSPLLQRVGTRIPKTRTELTAFDLTSRFTPPCFEHAPFSVFAVENVPPVHCAVAVFGASAGFCASVAKLRRRPCQTRRISNEALCSQTPASVRRGGALDEGATEARESRILARAEAGLREPSLGNGHTHVERLERLFGFFNQEPNADTRVTVSRESLKMATTSPVLTSMSPSVTRD
jgi:hypothetical protein